jgi:hypothetical protein
MTSDAARKQLERIALALRIDRSGNKMSPYGFCRRHRRRYVVDSKELTCCSKYIYKGRTNCDYTKKLPSLGD